MQDAKSRILMYNHLKNSTGRYQVMPSTISVTSVALPYPKEQKVSNIIVQQCNPAITKYRGFRQLKQQQKMKSKQKITKSRLNTLQSKKQNDINTFLEEFDVVQIIKLKLHKNDDKAQRQRLKTDYTVNRHNKSYLKHYLINRNHYLQSKAMNFMVKHLPISNKSFRQKTQEVVVDLNSNHQPKDNEEVISFRAQSVNSRKHDTLKVYHNRSKKKQQLIHYTSHNFQKKSFNKNRSPRTQQIFNKYKSDKIYSKQRQLKPSQTKYKIPKSQFSSKQEQLTGWQIQFQPEAQILEQQQRHKRCKKSNRRVKRRCQDKKLVAKQC